MTASSSFTIPRLEMDPETGRQLLMVKDKPFLCLAGELQNSSSSSASYMEKQMENLRSMNLNTILMAVSWEQIEPIENTFDFAELEANILLARKYDFKLVLVWFGNYKNGMSTYVPSWVKKDPNRFPRCSIHCPNNDQESIVEVLTPFAKENWNADAKAFGHLMSHIKEIDSVENTVIMVQVENEPGLLGDSRDRSREAQSNWDAGVPKLLLERLAKTTLHPILLSRLPNLPKILQNAALSSSTSDGWIEVFGSQADEVFMADAFSQYVEQVARAGKEAYAIPFFINTWLSCDDVTCLDLEGIPLKHNMTTAAGGGNKPGDYPSGGCCPQMLNVWQQNAPSLDIFSPDIYLHNFQWVCEQYVGQNNTTQRTLVIPEMRRDEYGARRLMLAYGNYNCLAASPFGIDTMKANEAPFSRIFKLLKKVEKPLLKAKPGLETFGFCFDEIDRSRSTIEETRVKIMGDWKIIIKRAHVFGVPGPGCGIVIQEAHDKFLCIGWGYSVYFSHENKQFTGILSAMELDYVNTEDGQGTLKQGRLLNGDETRSGACLTMPNEYPDEGGFPIPITIPSGTAITVCQPYAL
ncbi:uncharacterized protein FA14DRAFT_162616 [Meira miltonrushii]|uniref:Glycoside hydrolase n=1 Tax=Meira miltonrushii TaxID=1280837 RepID=A0A316V885_9BASI|nr:uncharacterized protein FA14DRAFT_162616 [Meira miltonrushii]PWN31685.1 hypothetical protein FA14DRAFT_162616 [Meira miltonrushii]